MSAGVVIRIDHPFDTTGWQFALKALGCTEVYELPGVGTPLRASIKLETLHDLLRYHGDAKVVVVQNREGDFIQGDQDLRDFEHPDEAIYVFGGSQTRMRVDDFYGTSPVAHVYIPTGDLMPSQAGAIVLCDRILKGAAK